MKDDSDFISFIDTYSERLFHVARLLTGSPVSAEDLLQETLSALYPRWERVSEADHPLAYVRRALTNRYISSNRRQPDIVLTDTMPETSGSLSSFDAIADRDLLTHLLRPLPARQRSAIVLRYLEDLSDNEIARILDCRAGTVRSLISRGLVQLRNQDLLTATIDYGRTGE